MSAVHGTNAGYQRHIDAGSPPCPECREARRRYRRAHRSRHATVTAATRFLVSARLLGKLRTTATDDAVILMNDELSSEAVTAILETADDTEGGRRAS